MLYRSLWLAAMLAALSLSASAQMPEGRNEIVTTEPRLGDVWANARMPDWMHILNEGGAPEAGNPQGAGLCVISSNVADGWLQDVADLPRGKKSRLWLLAKARPGGYYPAKLEKLLNEALPGVRWASWEETSTDLVEEYNRRGFAVGVTMNTGQFYQWQRIHHMVSLIHMDKVLVCIVDNNHPGFYHWMRREEFDRRFVDGEKGWMVVFLDEPGGDSLLMSAALLLSAGAVIELNRQKEREVS